MKRKLTEEEKAEQIRPFAVMYVAQLVDSGGKFAAGPHWCVVLDSKEQIAARLESGHDCFKVVGISHDEVISAPEFRMRVPSKFGLSGHIQCEWVTLAHFNHIEQIKSGEVDVPDREVMFKKIHAARAAKKKGSTRS